MAQTVTIDRLLNLVPERPDNVVELLSSHQDLASAQDRHGYSLLHAAASYNHFELAKKLVNDYNVDINIRDEDGDPPLCSVETVEMARLLVEELHADIGCRNDEGQTPEEKIDADEEFPLIAAYIREAASRGSGGAGASAVAQTAGANNSLAALSGTTNGSTMFNGIHHPPRIPQGINDIRIGQTTEPMDEDFQPDPEIRRRIEELASREDFQSEENQAELRGLISDVVGGLRQEQTDDRSTRRRVD
ncbi:Ankyrin repeat-containing protein 5 [Elsinoe fawcettii]|nr:Ankyrin repeat-containing protein 5 [Elsinoe fawcettii]